MIPAEPQAAAWETIACPVCDGSDFTTLFEKGGEPFVTCAGCGLLLINPRPLPGPGRGPYDSGYTDHYLRKADKKRARCRRAVRRMRAWVAAGRWLDVGCSAGFLVQAAHEAGYAACGIDLEPAAVHYASRVLGLATVRRATLEDLDPGAGQFDIITAYDVIEHVPDLNGFVARLARLLAPAGVIEIRTPDAGHWRVPRRVHEWPEIKPSEHLYYFNRRTLARLLARHGLAIAHRRPAFKPGLKVFVRHTWER